ncbi:hypothetical protein SCLCIDRAFT_921506 [Scleroderma citrinum Foug A]|uniref:Uncharacterized protein n=1 Tax=Scleroderma citrinum Foug A TaxID=1036808 RepID=A0A0C3A872_9AGAM|nr:hypothetical protein SCLCIDRAFT_921506 [Scleroderma citrinum Foug A]
MVTVTNADMAWDKLDLQQTSFVHHKLCFITLPITEACVLFVSKQYAVTFCYRCRTPSQVLRYVHCNQRKGVDSWGCTLAEGLLGCDCTHRWLPY